MTQLGWVGVWLLVAAGLAILIEVALVAVWAVAIGKRTRKITQWMETDRVLVEADLERLRLAIDEMQAAARSRDCDPRAFSRARDGKVFAQLD